MCSCSEHPTAYRRVRNRVGCGALETILLAFAHGCDLVGGLNSQAYVADFGPSTFPRMKTLNMTTRRGFRAVVGWPCRWCSRLIGSFGTRLILLAVLSAGLAIAATSCSFEHGGVKSFVGNTTEYGPVVSFLCQATNSQPVLMIVWLGKGDTARSAMFERFAYINGKMVASKETPPGAYALQSDYTLKRLEISEHEFSRFFGHLTSLNDDDLGDLWNEKIQPHLQHPARN